MQARFFKMRSAAVFSVRFITAAVAIVLCLVHPRPATAQLSVLEDLGVGVIENADVQLSARINGIVEALSTSSSVFTSAGGSGADLALESESVGTHEILVDTWLKTYGGYWDQPTSGTTTGSEGKRAGVVGGLALPVGSEWLVGPFGGVDYSDIDYTNGEEAQATAAYGGLQVGYSAANGFFAGLAGVAGYVWNETAQPIEIAGAGYDESASYGSTFIAVIGKVGRLVPMTETMALRLTASGSYAGEWTDSYDYSLVGGEFEVDDAFTQAVDGRLELAVEREVQIGLHGYVEAFAGLLGHYQLSGDQTLVADGSIFSILDPSVESYAGLVGLGVAGRFALNFGASARGQVYYSSDGTTAIAGYLRAVAIF